MHAHASDPDAWEGLFVAEAGVAAVLAGLLFVAVSINLGKILPLLGAELLTAGVLAWLVQVGIRLQAVRDRAGPSPAVLIGRIGLAQAAVLPLPGAGVSLLLGAGGGLYWLVPGVRPGPCGRAAGRVGAADRDPAVSATTKQVGTDPAVVSELGLLPGTTMLLVGAAGGAGSFLTQRATGAGARRMRSRASPRPSARALTERRWRAAGACGCTPHPAVTVCAG